MSVIEDRHAGFLQAVLAGPGSRGALVPGKSLGSASVALSQAALFLALMPWAGFRPLAVDWPLLLAALTLAAVGLAALGFAVAWNVDNVMGYHAVQMTLSSRCGSCPAPCFRRARPARLRRRDAREPGGLRRLGGPARALRAGGAGCPPRLRRPRPRRPRPVRRRRARARPPRRPPSRPPPMTLADVLPTVNAALNATSAVLLFAGWRAIRAGRRDLHRALMLSAFGSSTLFLASYLTRVALTGRTASPGAASCIAAYLAVLASHTLLAVAALPLVLRALVLRAPGPVPGARRVARSTSQIWLYVSVTGVVVYVMLYGLPMSFDRFRKMPEPPSLLRVRGSGHSRALAAFGSLAGALLHGHGDGNCLDLAVGCCGTRKRDSSRRACVAGRHDYVGQVGAAPVLVNFSLRRVPAKSPVTGPPS